jgi:hypothetical protein
LGVPLKKGCVLAKFVNVLACFEILVGWPCSQTIPTKNKTDWTRGASSAHPSKKNALRSKKNNARLKTVTGKRQRQSASRHPIPMAMMDPMVGHLPLGSY